MAILKPYVAWLNCLEYTLSKAVHNPHYDHLMSPLFELDIEWESKSKAPLEQLKESARKPINATIDALRQAHRFVVPDDFHVENILDEIGDDGSIAIKELIKLNPHLPYPTMYLQVPYEAVFSNRDLMDKELNVDTTHPRYVVMLLQEVGMLFPDGEAHGLMMNVGLYREMGSQFRAGCDFMPLSFGFKEAVDGEYDFRGEKSGLYGYVWPGFRWVDEDTKTRSSGEKTNLNFTGICAFMCQVALSVVHLVNHYPVQLRESKGLKRIIKPSDAIPRRARMEHTIIRLGTPYYEQIRAEKEERERIRHRDHAVRGHWRHYKNGRAVWIKSHRRGDPALGSVDSEYEIKDPERAQKT